jgi:hypothetical protein
MGTNRPRLELADLQIPGALPFVLDDPAEEEWCHYHGIMGGMAHLLNAALVAANNGLKQLNSVVDPYEVRRARALVAASFFVTFDLCSFHSR